MEHSWGMVWARGMVGAITLGARLGHGRVNDLQLLGASLGHNWGTKLKFWWHGWGTVGARLEQGWGTVGARGKVGARLRHGLCNVATISYEIIFHIMR